MDISLTPDLEEKKKRKNKKERNLEDGWLKEPTLGSIATENSLFEVSFLFVSLFFLLLEIEYEGCIRNS